VIATALPLSLETLALKRLTVTAAGVLSSLEPALAAAAGYLVLGQRLAPTEIAGIALVVLASIRAVRTAGDAMRAP
jgi:inner membrane transporter RhtA